MLEFFSRVFGVVLHGWTTDHRPQLWVVHPRLHWRPRRLFLSGTVAEFQIYSLFNPSFLVSAIILLLLFLILHFSIWNLVAGYLFVCVCDVLDVALFRLSSFFFAEIGFAFGNFFCNRTLFLFFLAKLGGGSVPSCSPFCIWNSKIGHLSFSTPGFFLFRVLEQTLFLLYTKLFQQCVVQILLSLARSHRRLIWKYAILCGLWNKNCLRRLFLQPPIRYFFSTFLFFVPSLKRRLIPLFVPVFFVVSFACFIVPLCLH